MFNIIAVIFFILVGLLLLATVGLFFYILWGIISFAGVGVFFVGLLWFIISAIKDKT